MRTPPTQGRAQWRRGRGSQTEASERAAPSEVDGEGLRAVLGQHPSEAIREIVLQDDDLVARRRAERAGEREVRAVREALADDQARGRRQRIRRGGAEAWGDLHGVDAE